MHDNDDEARSILHFKQFQTDRMASNAPFRVRYKQVEDCTIHSGVYTLVRSEPSPNDEKATLCPVVRSMHPSQHARRLPTTGYGRHPSRSLHTRA